MSAKVRTVVLSGAAALICLLVGLWFGARWQQSRPGTIPETKSEGAAKANPKTDRTVLYWHDPMVPGHKFDKPGKSPFMDMQLVPVYADDAAASSVRINPGFAQTLGIRTATVRRAALASGLEAVGTVAENERSVVTVQTRATGYVERLHVRAVLDSVKRGQPLATLFVPEWNAALEEYLGLRAAAAPPSLLEAARSRMSLLSIPRAAIAKSELTGAAQSRFTVRAPTGGIVTELTAREGMQVAPGTTLFRIADLSAVWIYADVPEGQAGSVAPGSTAEVRVAAYPDEVFKGEVSTILPEVAAATRTLRARLEIANPGRLLRPGMYVRVFLQSASDEPTLVVPQEAVIATGRRTVVVVASDDNTYQPVDVTLGRSSGADVEVTSGLSEGQKVVASGQFLLDSEASLRAGLSRLSTPAAVATATANATPEAAAAAPPAGTFTGEGVVEAVTKTALTISHGPIPALKWPSMTMDFAVPKDGLAKVPKVGERIRFDFTDEAGDYVLRKVEPMAGAGARK